MIITLTVFHPVPSLNVLLAENRFKQVRRKRETQFAILSALKAIESTCLMKITSSSNGSLTPSATLESYLLMRQIKRGSSRRKSRSRTRPKRKLSFK